MGPRVAYHSWKSAISLIQSNSTLKFPAEKNPARQGYHKRTIEEYTIFKAYPQDSMHTKSWRRNKIKHHSHLMPKKHQTSPKNTKEYRIGLQTTAGGEEKGEVENHWHRRPCNRRSTHSKRCNEIFLACEESGKQGESAQERYEAQVGINDAETECGLLAMDAPLLTRGATTIA